MTDLIQTEQDGAILTIRLNRADKKNAITAAMYSAMADVLRGADSNTSIKVAIITGSGDSFTAGNDLKDFAENPPKDPTAPVFAFMDAMASFTKPVRGPLAICWNEQPQLVIMPSGGTPQELSRVARVERFAPAAAA